jgi:hypothetical protein
MPGFTGFTSLISMIVIFADLLPAAFTFPPSGEAVAGRILNHSSRYDLYLMGLFLPINIKSVELAVKD